MVETLKVAPVRLYHELIVAGFGGQGVQTLGQILAEAALLEGREVVWTPAYGPEMRGGPSFCTVILSDRAIGSPVVATADTAIIMDQPSVAKYQQRLRTTGRIIYNSTLVKPELLRSDIPSFAVPASELAEELGMAQVTNMVILGAFIYLTKLVAPESILAALRNSLPERKHNLLPINEKALLLGAQACLNNSCVIE